MNDPIRNDVFEDASGVQVAVKQMYPPNALGVSFVEYKNLGDSNLRFMPKEQFLETFNWVDNFGTTDIFVKAALEQETKLPVNAEDKDVSSADTVAEVATPVEDSGSENATPTRSS
jgi:hypothetical protein